MTTQEPTTPPPPTYEQRLAAGLDQWAEKVLCEGVPCKGADGGVVLNKDGEPILVPAPAAMAREARLWLERRAIVMKAINPHGQDPNKDEYLKSLGVSDVALNRLPGVTDE